MFCSLLFVKLRKFMNNLQKTGINLQPFSNIFVEINFLSKVAKQLSVLYDLIIMSIYQTDFPNSVSNFLNYDRKEYIFTITQSVCEEVCGLQYCQLTKESLLEMFFFNYCLGTYYQKTYHRYLAYCSEHIF